MGHKVATATVSTEVQSLDRVRPHMAKAEIASPSQSIPWSDVLRDALVRHFGSLKAAAISMEIDQSQLTREIETGKLNVARLQKCEAGFAVKFAQLMIAHAEPLTTPQSLIRAEIRKIRASLETVEQGIEHIG